METFFLCKKMETFVRLTKLIYLDTFLGINKFETIVPQRKAATGSSVGLGMEGEALRSSSRHNAGTAKNAGKKHDDSGSPPIIPG